MWCHEVIGKGRWFKKAVRRNTNFHFRLKVWSLCVALEQRSIWDNLIFSFLSQNLQVLFVATMYIQSCRAIWPFDYYCNSLFPFFVLEYYWLSYHKVWATLLYLSHVVSYPYDIYKIFTSGLAQGCNFKTFKIHETNLNI